MANINTHSSYFEKLVEHLFIADILQTAWLKGEKQIEIARSEIDNSGYDLILECNNIIRHVQLKSSEISATTNTQNINIKLADKPGGCVVWIFRQSNNKKNNFSLQYRFFGNVAGEKLPLLDNFKTSRHSKANASGIKNERPNIKKIPKSKFIEIKKTEELLNKLFGI